MNGPQEGTVRVQQRSEKADAEQNEGESESRPTARTLAEWVSLGVSALLIISMVGFLIYEGVRGQPPFVPTQVRPLAHEARRLGERYILPIEVRNLGDRTLRELEIEATYRTPEGKEETQEFTVAYLGEGSSTRLYLYLDRDPSGEKIEARAVHYLSD